MNRIPRVLIVDDDHDLVFLLLETLHRHRFRDRINLTAISDSVTAQQLVQKKRAEVLVTDLDMPKVDGFELVKAAQTANPDIAIVVFSGRAEEHETHLRTAYGIADCIPKSGNFDRLLAAVDKALTGLGGKNLPPTQPVPPPVILQAWPASQHIRG